MDEEIVQRGVIRSWLRQYGRTGEGVRKYEKGKEKRRFSVVKNGIDSRPPGEEVQRITTVSITCAVVKVHHLAITFPI